MAKVEPDAGEHTGVTAPLTMSVADAVNDTAAPDSDVAAAVIGAGSVSTGGVVSRTVTVNEAEPVLPAVRGRARHGCRPEREGRARRRRAGVATAAGNRIRRRRREGHRGAGRAGGFSGDGRGRA